MPSSLPSNLNEWLLALTVIVIIADRIFSFWKNHLREQPTPSETYATKGELSAVKRDIAVIDTDLKTLRREIVENGEKRRISIEGKVDRTSLAASGEIKELRTEVLSQISDMKAEIKSDFESDLSRIETKLDRFIARETQS